MSRKDLIFTGCTTHCRVVWSTQPAADKEGFPCLGQKILFLLGIVWDSIFLKEVCPV